MEKINANEIDSLLREELSKLQAARINIVESNEISHKSIKDIEELTNKLEKFYESIDKSKSELEEIKLRINDVVSIDDITNLKSKIDNQLVEINTLNTDNVNQLTELKQKIHDLILFKQNFKSININDFDEKFEKYLDLETYNSNFENFQVDNSEKLNRITDKISEIVLENQKLSERIDLTSLELQKNSEGKEKYINEITDIRSKIELIEIALKKNDISTNELIISSKQAIKDVGNLIKNYNLIETEILNNVNKSSKLNSENLKELIYRNNEKLNINYKDIETELSRLSNKIIDTQKENVEFNSKINELKGQNSKLKKSIKVITFLTVLISFSILIFNLKTIVF